MKIAVTSTGPKLDDTMDPRFGRCAYFIIVETDDMSFKAFNNENIALGGGAGIQSAQFVASKGAGVVLTGNCGPNAIQTLSASHVEVFVGQSGTVREAIERHTRGDIKPTSKPNVADHYGMGSGGGMGRGMGMGRGGGMGKGMGQGMGRGMSGSTFGGTDQSEPIELSKKEELKRLKDQANDLQKQIEKIESTVNVSGKKQ